MVYGKQENTHRNSVRINKYKWKLLPKHKYNTQIYEENNLNIIKKEKENKIIKLLENKIKNLEKKINEENWNKLAESQKILELKN